MKKLLILNLLLSFCLLVAVKTNAQEKPKKKGGFFKEIFDELKEDLMGAPGAIDKSNISKYYNAFVNKESKDSTIQRVVWGLGSAQALMKENIGYERTSGQFHHSITYHRLLTNIKPFLKMHRPALPWFPTFSIKQVTIGARKATAGFGLI